MDDQGRAYKIWKRPVAGTVVEIVRICKTASWCLFLVVFWGKDMSGVVTVRIFGEVQACKQ